MAFQFNVQIETTLNELAALKESTRLNADASEGDTDTGAELRRLRIELDMKGSEMDTVLKEATEARAELKEMKGMFNAAEAGAGAAGADEDSLRKRLSQLTCENGLLKGEKDRLEALAVAAEAESKSSSSRAAADVERLEREIVALQEREQKSSAAVADGDHAKSALAHMEAQLSSLRQECTELKVALSYCTYGRGSGRVFPWHVRSVSILLND